MEYKAGICYIFCCADYRFFGINNYEELKNRDKRRIINYKRNYFENDVGINVIKKEIDEKTFNKCKYKVYHVIC